MRVGIDYRPALLSRSGIGRYVKNLVLHLPAMEDYNHYLHTVLADVPGIAGIETSIVIGNVKHIKTRGVLLTDESLPPCPVSLRIRW